MKIEELEQAVNHKAEALEIAYNFELMDKLAKLIRRYIPITEEMPYDSFQWRNDFGIQNPTYTIAGITFSFKMESFAGGWFLHNNSLQAETTVLGWFKKPTKITKSIESIEDLQRLIVRRRQYLNSLPEIALGNSQIGDQR